MKSQSNTAVQFGVTVKISPEVRKKGQKKASGALSSYYNTVIFQDRIARHQDAKDNVYWTFNGPNDKDYEKFLQTARSERGSFTSLFARFQKHYDASLSLDDTGEIQITPRDTWGKLPRNLLNAAKKRLSSVSESLKQRFSHYKDTYK